MFLADLHQDEISECFTEDIESEAPWPVYKRCTDVFLYLRELYYTGISAFACHLGSNNDRKVPKGQRMVQIRFTCTSVNNIIVIIVCFVSRR